MVDYADSSQLNLWLFDSPEDLHLCRSKANYRAREYLFSLHDTNKEQGLSVVTAPAHHQEPPPPPTSGVDGGPSSQSDHNAASAAPAAAPSTTKLQSNAPTVPIEQFACGFSERPDRGSDLELQRYRGGPWERPPPLVVGDGSSDTKSSTAPCSYLTVEEEQILVNFYVSKLPSLIGPQAQVPRLRRESKVTATAALLIRRFFASNSVMLHDPKTVLVAAAFLGSKAEDATADVRSLEEGTALMNARVTKDDIIPAEVSLLAGTHFDLLCFHPYKTVLAITEDLRTYLKSEQGKGLVTMAAVSSSSSSNGVARGENDDDDDNNNNNDNDADPSDATHQRRRPPHPLLSVSGQDLKPMYDAARVLLDDVILSDLPLLFNPGHVGLAALVVALDQVLQQDPQLPHIDLIGYMKQRFDPTPPNPSSSSSSSNDLAWLDDTLPTICQMLRELKQGLWGCCGKYEPNLSQLKAIHKKLKKVRAWGIVKETSSVGTASKKRSRDAGDAHGADPSGASDGTRKKAKKMT